MESNEALFDIPLFGHEVGFSKNIVIQWVIILIVAIVAFLLTRNLKKIPNKKQSVLEALVEFINSTVKEIMGEHFIELAPYVLSLGFFLLIMNLTGLVGVHPPTKEYGVTLGMGLTTFIVIQWYVIKQVGIGHYFLGYFKPIPFMLPMNILERVMLPISLSLRLFGNITAGVVIMGLIYNGLANIVPFAQLAIPIPFHMYFDIFDGGIQMVVFTMLTMVNLKIIAEH